MSVVRITYKVPKTDELGIKIENEFITKDFDVNYSELKRYIKNEGGPVTSHTFTNIDQESHDKIKEIIVDNPKEVILNESQTILAKSIFVVRVESFGFEEVLNLEINEKLDSASCLI